MKAQSFVISEKAWWIALMLFVAGCTTTRLGDNLDRGTIGIEFSFKRHNMCNNGSSPALVLSNLPEGTVRLKVTMRDLDHPIADHGGGVLENFSGHTVPEGALKQYSGPCPMMSDLRRYKYVMKVVAYDANGTQLAFGQKMKLCGWTDFE